MELIKGYQAQEDLRRSFNELAGETFGLNFEDWYQNGYWREHYIPYSITDHGNVVANVSVNPIEFEIDGTEKLLVQLGTVMTKKAYRNRGLIRRIMAEIEKDYGKKADGMYLFGNDSVLQFYPKFGYRPAKEYKCEKEIRTTTPRRVIQAPMKEKKAWDRLEQAMKESSSISGFAMKNNPELILFYVTKFMQDTVYKLENEPGYIIAEEEEGTLLLQDYYFPTPKQPEEIIAAFGPDIRRAVLAYTPKDTTSWQVSEHKEEDCTLFIKGPWFENWNSHQRKFAALSHA
ncbi:MAG: GNAT family N-acetyltransferase [Fusicatenibacter sp.]|nr:GNAT family N-acetyltransferase [Fusicatenibacter sp.]